MWLAALDWSLRAAGTMCCGGLAYTGFRFKRAQKKCCDNKAADATMPSDAYKGKVVWITGASSGIGKELTVQLARQGAKLIISARREQVLCEVAAELKQTLAGSGGEISVLPLDLENIESLDAKSQEALKIFGRVDILINNGGYTSRALARDTHGIEPEIKMMKVNFLSYVAITKSLMPSMMQRKSGHIVNISSLAGKFGTPMRTLYCGSKHATMGWFDALRVEEASFKSGILVTNVCPGSVKTDVAKNAVTADGSLRGYSDPNIESGLSVEFTCDRILAGVHCGLDEIWLAVPAELSACYLGQYFPETLKGKLKDMGPGMMTRVMGEEFVKERMNSS
eukprot:gnl/TRDRNA2_/TRDRNA2_82209_c0_seq1.p1 gnl/TRDRNA2_/TRDRNA2_82209_c0~~gnl/TRDRNA2_/TRDRNA2_82209_c0_seq1.p1  ORF type:complete len:338 (+),score=76.22 gnl/TRDRNA2_/TRDRNA2_82209_c0_seq1:93-1106(+)